jgi:hypothetical protein
MSCPYRTRKELVNWLVTYKGYNKHQANKLTTKQMYFFYYNSEKIFNTSKTT